MTGVEAPSASIEADRCALLSRELGEEIIGTASTVRRWLLVEQPGAWGPASVPLADEPGGVADGLAVLARANRTRVLLVRSPTRIAPSRRRCYVVESGPGRPWIRRLTVDDPGDLLDLDLEAAFATGGEGLGEAHDTPLFLVCTHGRHDPCCADFGRPLVRALTGLDGLWESSHVGGDRFAGNLVCLPHGLYYGRVEPEDGQAVVDAYRGGQVDLAHYRGRSCHDFVTQAAEWFLRDALALTGVEGVAAAGRTALGQGRHAVRFEVAELGTRVVQVQVSDVDVPRTIACRGPGPSRPRTYRLLAVETP